MTDRILQLLLQLGLGLLIFLRPFKSGLVYPSCNVLFFVGVLFLFFVWFLKSILLGQISFRRTPGDFLHLLFLAGVLFSWFYAVNWNEGIQFLLNVGTAILIYHLLIQTCRDEKDWLKVIGVILVSASLVSLFGLYQRFFGLEETRAWVQSHFSLENFPDSFKARLSSSRIFSTFIYPNALAGYLLMILPLGFVVWAIRQTRFHAGVVLSSGVSGALLFWICEKTAWMGLAFLVSIFYPILYLLAFFFTLSKGGFLTFFLVRIAAYVLVFNMAPSRFRKAVFWGGFLLESGIAFCILFHSDMLGLKSGLSLNVRLDYWKATLGMIQDFPLRGVGPGCFGSIYGHYKYPGAEETRMAHHSFLQICAETGVVSGLIFFLIWFLPLISGLRKILKRGQDRSSLNILQIGAWLGLFGFFIHNMMDFDLYEPAITLNAWILLALLNEGPSPGRSWTIPLKSSLAKISAILLGQAVVIALILWVRIPYQADGFLEGAIKAHAKKNWVLASAMIDRSLALNPRNGYAHSLKASIAQSMGHWDEALFYCAQACQRDPFNPSFRFQQAWAYESLARVRHENYGFQIEASLKKAIENYPTQPQFHKKIAQFYESIGRKKDALIEYGKTREFGFDPPALRRIMRRLKDASEVHQQK